MKPISKPVNPTMQKVKKVNSLVHKPATATSIKPIKPARPAFAKKPK